MSTDTEDDDRNKNPSQQCLVMPGIKPKLPVILAG